MKREAIERRLFVDRATSELHRRPLDWFRLAVCVVLLGLLAVHDGEEGSFEVDLARTLADLPSWVHDVAHAAYRLATLWLAVVLVLGALVFRRWRLARDLGVAAAAVVALAAALDALIGANPDFPAARVALVTGLLAAAAPHLQRPVRRTGQVAVLVVVVSSAVLLKGTPGAVLAGLLLGVAIAAALHLAFGSPLGRPTPAQVLATLEHLGHRVPTGPVRWSSVHGAVRVVVGDGRDLLVVDAYGRDAADARLGSRLWHLLWYRGRASRILASPRQRVDDAALVTLLAREAGVAVPCLEAVGIDDGVALIAVRRPDGRTLADVPPAELDDALLAAGWHEVAALHRARIAHRQLDLDHIVVDGSGSALLVDLLEAEHGASDRLRSRDVAELLVSSAAVVGVDRAVGAAVRGVGPAAVAASLPFVQPPALSEVTKDRVKEANRGRAEGEKKLLPALREAAAARSGGEVPQLEQLRRVKIQDLLFIGATLFGVTILLSQLSDVGDVLDEMRGANWWWVAVALGFSLCTSPSDAIAVTGAVEVPIEYGPTAVLEYSLRFTNLVVPSSVGSAAMRARFLTTQGVGLNEAIIAGLLVSVAGFVVQMLILLAGLTVFDIQLTLGDALSGNETAKILILVLLGVGVIISLIWFIPAIRKRVLPQLGIAWHAVRSLLTSVRRVLLVLGGNLASQTVYALALGCAVEAFGYHLNLGTLLVINTVVTLFAGIMPVPGGMGVAEAALAAGLTAAGMPASAATAAAITHRLVTFYLPPLWGWPALRWLTKRGYI